MDRDEITFKVDKISQPPHAVGMVGSDLRVEITALADLISSCVDHLELINQERDLSQEYEVSLVIMTLLEARLRCWADSIDLSAAGQEDCHPRRRWVQEEKEVAQSLIGIKNVLLNLCVAGQTTLPAEGRYGLWTKYSDNPKGISSSLQDVKRAFQPAAKDHSLELLLAPWGNICQVPCDQIGLDTLINSLATYIDRLERVSRLQVLGQQRGHLQAKLATINSRPVMSLLVTAAIESDLLTNSSIVQHQENRTGLDCTDGHFYMGRIILARARGLNKDIVGTDYGPELAGI